MLKELPDLCAFTRAINISDLADSTGNRKRTFKSSHAYRLGESFGVEWYALLHRDIHEKRKGRAVCRHLLVSIINFGLIVFATIRFCCFPARTLHLQDRKSSNQNRRNGRLFNSLRPVVSHSYFYMST